MMPNTRKLLFTLLVLILIFPLYAQNIDSLLHLQDNVKDTKTKFDINLKLANAYNDKRNWDSVDLFIKKAILLANSINENEYFATVYDLAGVAKDNQGYYEIADSLYSESLKYATDDDEIKLYINKYGLSIRLGRVEKGKSYLDKARQLIGNDTTSLLMGNYYYSLGTYYQEQHSFIKALKYLLKSKKIFLHYKERLDEVNRALSSIYFILKDYERYNQIQVELRQKAKEEKDYKSELFSLYGMMFGQAESKDYEAVIKTCYEAIELKNTRNITQAFGYVYYTLGIAYLETNQLDSAEYFFNQGIEISKKQNELKELGETHTGMAKLMYQKRNYKQAKFHAIKAREFISYIDTKNNTILAKVYVKEGNYKQAYELSQLNVSHFETEKEKNTTYQLTTELLNYKFEQEQTIERNQFEEKIKKQRQRLYKAIIIAIFLLLGSIVFTQVRNNRRLKQLNQRLQQQNEALQQFSYIASHDIKEPIRSIGNTIGLIRHKLPKEHKDNFKPYFALVNDGVRQLYNLTEDIMKYTQIGQNETIETTETNVNTIVQNVESNLETYLNEINGEIIYENLPTIQSNGSMLFIVLKNVIENGLKFNHSDIPTVHINYKSTSNKHIFEIKDNGIGIEPKYHEHVFKMFKKLHNKGKYEGSGLGLAIVKNIIDKFNGTIEVDSSPQKGTTFIIKLLK
ncbi:MAG: ATP-binding protein [Saprospiraceae bacterium]